MVKTIIELDDGKNLQESLIFDGKNNGFPVDFPLNQSSETTNQMTPRAVKTPDQVFPWLSGMDD